jgi:hypothetical protein
MKTFSGLGCKYQLLNGTNGIFSEEMQTGSRFGTLAAHTGITLPGSCQRDVLPALLPQGRMRTDESRNLGLSSNVAATTCSFQTRCPDAVADRAARRESAPRSKRSVENGANFSPVTVFEGTKKEPAVLTSPLPDTRDDFRTLNPRVRVKVATEFFQGASVL